MSETAQNPLNTFIIYAREDKDALLELKKQLIPLERSRQIAVWHDGEIVPGEEWEKRIKTQLETADIILLLLSSDFFASDYIEKEELRAALARHERAEAVVAPVLVRHCLWQAHPEIEKLQVLPDNAFPVYSKRNWDSPDEAFANVAAGIARMVKNKADAAAEKQRQIEAEKQRKEEEARKKREAEEAARKKLEIEEAARKKLAEEEAARKKWEAEETVRLETEAEEQKRREEEAARKKREEEEAARKEWEAKKAVRKFLIERNKREAEEIARKKREEEETVRLETEAEEQKRREEDASRKKLEVEEAARKKRKREEINRKKREEEEFARIFMTDMVPVKGGAFEMGCKLSWIMGRDGVCFDNENPVHEATPKDFHIGKYPVTQMQWRAVMGHTPSHFTDYDNCPVDSVSWNDIQTFLKKLNTLTGRRFRLPTETEWEYAARGGQQSKGYRYSGSNRLGDVGWYDENSDGKTHPVGQKQPNELGLHDMSGNVWEWCEDDWHSNYEGAPTDGRAWVDKPRGAFRVGRGGSWRVVVRGCRTANRYGWNPAFRGGYVGFRLALSVE